MTTERLTETTARLTKTKENLRETKITLKHAEIDRDAHKQLNSELKRSEDELYHTANSVMNHLLKYLTLNIVVLGTACKLVLFFFFF